MTGAVGQLVSGSVGQPRRESLGTILQTTKRKRPPQKLIEAFVAGLDGKGWMSAGEFSDALGISDRLLRRLAEASEGRVISGQKGYKLTAEATPGEIHHACAWLLSQAQRMTDRARQIRVAQHRAPGAFSELPKTQKHASGGHVCADADAHPRLGATPKSGTTGPIPESFSVHQFGDH